MNLNMRRFGTIFICTLILLAFLSLTTPLTTKASGEGSLEGWNYRKSHIIENATGAGTNYQVKIIVHYGSGSDSGGNVYCNSHCKTDFGDVRFTDDDGSTLLDYWMETKTDSDNATFWVEVADDLSSSAQTIYIYYGNADATTTSNGANTFLLFDDFLGSSIDTTKWNKDTNYPTVADSLAKFTGSVRMGIYSKTAYGTSVKMRSRFQFAESSDTKSDLFVGFYSSTFVLYPNRRTDGWKLWSYGTAHNAITINTPAYNTWYTYEIDWSTTYLQGLRNDVLETSTTNTSYIPSSSLPAYLMSYNASPKFNIDWIFISKYVRTEPAHGAWGSEETLALTFSYISSDTTFAGAPVELSINISGTASHYIWSWNNTGSWVNETAQAFVSNPVTFDAQWRAVTGDTVSVIVYANSSGNVWCASSQYDFTLTGKQITFYHTDGGTLNVNSSLVANGTTTNFAYGQITLEGIPESNHIFLNFTWDTGNTETNPHDFQIVTEDSETVWCFFIYSSIPQYSAISYSTDKYSQDSNFTITWSDDVALSGYVFGHNSTGQFTNGSWTAFTSNPETIINTVTLNDTKLNVVAYQWWANNSIGNWNTTGLLYMTVHGYNVTFIIGENGRLEINGTLYDSGTQSFNEQDFNTVYEYEAHPDAGYILRSYYVNGASQPYDSYSIALDNDYAIEAVFGESSGVVVTDDSAIAIAAFAVIFALIPLVGFMVSAKRAKREQYS